MSQFLQLARHPLFINGTSCFLLSLIAFRMNSPYLFYGTDGRFEVTLITQSSLFTPVLLGYTNSFIHSLGNIWFVFNPHVIPEYFLALSEKGIFTNFALSYAIAAVELFIGTYACARMAQVPQIAALLAAWIAPLLTFRYVQFGEIPSTFGAFPHYATIAALSAVMAGSLLQLDRQRLSFSLGIAGLFFLGISYIVIAAPTLIILVAPQFAMFGLISVLSAKNRPDVIFRLGVLGSVFAICLLAGYVHFLAGLVSYTAADMFKGLSTRPATLQEISMLFWSPLQPFFTIERIFVALGLLGALWAACRAAGLLRLTAIAFLGTASAIIAVGFMHYFHHFWFGPAFWYFEGFLFPFHALFVALLVVESGRVVIRIGLKAENVPKLTVLATLIIAIVPWLHIRHQQKISPPTNLPYYIPYPQAETPVTKILKTEIALKPGTPFRGRAATLVGRIFPDSTNVDIVGLWGIPRFLANHATGNTHDGAGLWQDSIPTLLEYNPLMTPPYFAFTRSFFTEPVDLQLRNLVAMRHIDQRLLAVIGVRFVITDRPFAGGIHLRQVLNIPVNDAFLKRAGIPQAITDFSLYLYELDNVNLGQYSPSSPLFARTASEMLALLGDPATNLSHSFVTAENITEKLSAGHMDEFLVESGRFVVKATSPGHSVLILPMEYSRCLNLRTNGSGGPSARLFRANLLLTGVVFEKELNATISYRTGPFAGSRCRLHDKADMEAIEMRQSFKDRPQFLPAGMAY